MYLCKLNYLPKPGPRHDRLDALLPRQALLLLPLGLFPPQLLRLLGRLALLLVLAKLGLLLRFFAGLADDFVALELLLRLECDI